MNNVIAIVGKPNVGKSSLFNRLSSKRISIVYDQPGVTRDRIYNDIEWSGNTIRIIDTGGMEMENKPFQEQIRAQAEIAIKEANAIVFVVDGREQITQDELMIASMLRKSEKKVVVAANKLEGNIDFDTSLWQLGFDVFPISATHGEGIGDLLDEVSDSLDFTENIEDNSFKLSIIGRPNAGKSSLLNVLINEERAIVSPIAGTTRDSINSKMYIGDNEYEIIDTAGINRKSRLVESVDHYALMRAMDSLEQSSMTLLVIDATKELAFFDVRVGGYADELKKPIIIVINKWDLVEKETMTMKHMEDKIRKEFKFLSWAPIVFISAKNGQRLNRLKETITRVRENLEKHIKTSLLNDVILEIQTIHPPQLFKGGRLHISFCTQVEGKIPTFKLVVNNKVFLHFSYERFIENKFREFFGFEGTPIKLIYRNKKEEQ